MVPAVVLPDAVVPAVVLTDAVEPTDAVVPPVAVVPMVVVPGPRDGIVVSVAIVVFPCVDPPTVVRSPKSNEPPKAFAIVVVVVCAVVSGCSFA